MSHTKPILISHVLTTKCCPCHRHDVSSPPKPLKPLKKTFRCALGKLRHFLFSTYCPRIFSLFSPYFSRFQALLAPLSSPYVIPGPTMFTMLSLFSLIISIFSSYYLPISLYHFRLLSSYFYPHGMQQVTQHEKPHNFSGFESYCRNSAWCIPAGRLKETPKLVG